MFISEVWTIPRVIKALCFNGMNCVFLEFDGTLFKIFTFGNETTGSIVMQLHQIRFWVHICYF